MKSAVNPFRQLYVGESVGPNEFVKLFSPVLVEHSLALFQKGNVVLKGFTGAGKSMLLNLLLPEIRLAYDKMKEPFPIPKKFSKFIGAGINLQTSGVSHFGNRPIDDIYTTSHNTTPFYFADFLNYYVIADILDSIIKLKESPTVAEDIGIELNPSLYNSFALKLANNSCWFGYLNKVTDFQSLCDKISNRIFIYKSYLNFNISEIGDEIKETKTIIGEPISVVANTLKEVGIINEQVELFIRIDQYEELVWLSAKNDLGQLYQQIIHKLLGIRDSSVSYRVATRHFAWSEEKIMFGTTAPLEKKRNYLEFHLDNEMRRKENSRLWIFPRLAEDIFFRRLKKHGYVKSKKSKDLLKSVFGNRLTPSETSLEYFKGEKKSKAVDVEKEWPDSWKKFLWNLASKDPFEARLAEAWCRQKGKENVMREIPDGDSYPWDKIYWRKERTEQALMQLASRNQQQLNWSGKEDVLALSGGNILAFLSLCQHIWDVWLRDNRYEEDEVEESTLPALDNVIQSIGILEASTDWYNELAIDERGGKNRKKFVAFLGTIFFKTLIEDRAMSNPGHNGISLDLEELENSNLNIFLRECTDYGDLYDSPHTSKLKDKRKRWKFYLNPILSPYFKIPYVHTKEPIYITINSLSDWLKNSNIESPKHNFQFENYKNKNRKKKNQKESNNLSFDF